MNREDEIQKIGRLENKNPLCMQCITQDRTQKYSYCAHHLRDLRRDAAGCGLQAELSIAVHILSCISKHMCRENFESSQT